MAPSESTELLETETAIIGGGISGLACARQLSDAGKPFILISDTLGGRIHYSDDGLYFGAVVMTKDYTNIRRYATKAKSMWPWTGYVWNGQKAVNSMFLLDYKRLWHFARVMKKFRESIIRLRAEADHICQKTLLQRDPHLQKLVEQTAEEFVREHGLETVNERMLNPTVNAITFCPYEKMNAFNYCIALLASGNSACFADFTQTVPMLISGYEQNIHRQKVTSLQEIDDGRSYQVQTDDRTYQARNVVISTPVRNTIQFCDKLPSHVLNRTAHVIHIRGKRRAIYNPGKSLLFKPGNDVFVFFAQTGDLDIVYCPTPEPDLERYYQSYEVLDRISWKTGIQLSIDEWRPLQVQSNLYAIGDYNICGIEDSFLTGLFAANKIIGSA